MPNSLSVAPRAQAVIDRAGGDGREEILACLDYIQDHPEPDEDRVVTVPRAPLILYAYHCGIYDIVFYVDWSPATREARIKVLAIS